MGIIQAFRLRKYLQGEHNINGVLNIGDTELKKLQYVLLTMLESFDRVCRKYDIEYMLTGGCALGAVRHKGFIPWDDDVDINMTRKNFDRFITVFDKEMGQAFTLELMSNGVLYCDTVRLKNTAYLRTGDIGGSNKGICLEIFVLENTYNNKFARYLHGFLCTSVLIGCKSVKFLKIRDYFMELAGDDFVAKAILNFRTFVGICCSVLPNSTWSKLFYECSSMCKNDESKYVVAPFGVLGFFQETYERKRICPPVEADFEGHRFFIPKDVDYYLTKRYGDYMTIPPEEEREKHMVLEFDLGDFENIAIDKQEK